MRIKRLILLVIPVLLFSYLLQAQSIDYELIDDVYEYSYKNIPDSVFQESDQLFQQRKYQKVIEILLPYAQQSENFPDSQEEAEACHMLATAMLNFQNPQGYVYLEKLLRWSHHNNADHKTAEYYIHYSNILTFNKTMFAYELAEQAKNMLEKTPNQSIPLLLKSWQVSGKNLLSQGKPAKAIKDFKNGMALLQKGEGDLHQHQQLYSNLSIAFNMTGQADSSLKYSRKALKILQNMPSAPEMSISNVYGNLSRGLMLNNQLDSAIYYRKQALDINQKLTGSKSQQTGGSYYHLADTYLYKGDYDSALYYIQKSILTNYPGIKDTLTYEKLPEKLESNSNVNAVLQGLMEKILIMESLYDETSDKKWISLIVDHYSSVARLANQLQRSVNLQSLPQVIELNRQGYVEALNALERYKKANPDEYILEDMYYYATATKAKTLLYQIYNMRSKAGTQQDDQQKNQRNKLENKLNNLLVKRQTNTDSLMLDSLNKQILLTKIAISGLIDQSITRPSSDDEFETLAKPLKLKRIQTELDADEAFVEFVISENQIYAFYATTEKISMHKIARNESFERAYRDFLRNIKTGNAWSKSELTEILLKPFYTEIQDKDHFVIIPDNELYNVPFEAMHVPYESRALIEQHTISYHYSSRLWLESKNKTQKFSGEEIPYDLISFAPGFKDKSNAAIAQNVNYRNINLEDYSEMFESNDRNYLAPLPYSLEEVNLINTLFAEKQHKTLLHQENRATETNLRSVPATEILHIATHGFSSEKSPELSGLFFTKEKDTDESTDKDGILYINELFGLNLNANLVVLSACKSGTGKILKGEGIYALPRGFIFAGIPNMIASMWKIHDEKTMTLITSFYDAVAKGESYRKALQSAKVKMIEEGELPLDWSGMILIGY
ncbi:MAG: CHAT domain-containing protein [Bacteroidota bacterium]